MKVSSVAFKLVLILSVSLFFHAALFGNSDNEGQCCIFNNRGIVCANVCTNIFHSKSYHHYHTFLVFFIALICCNIFYGKYDTFLKFLDDNCRHIFIYSEADSGLVKLVVITNVFFNKQQDEIEIKLFVCVKQKTFLCMVYAKREKRPLQKTKFSVKFPSRQILVPGTSRGRSSPTSLERPLKILFDYPGDVLKWHPGDVLI